jgi:hypothetical protein
VVVKHDTRLIALLAALVALLGLGLVAAVWLRPSPTGLVIIHLPEDVQGTVSLQINGEAVTEKDGAPLRDWPVVRQVRVGPAVVLLTAPGYAPLVEILDVKETEPVQLSKEMRKSK